MEDITEATFMNRTAELFDINISSKQYVVEVSNIREDNQHLLPLGLSYPLMEERFIFLHHWLSNRCIPETRARIWNLRTVALPLCLVGISIKANALSLSDQYWIRLNPSEKWEDLNFFDNPFSDKVGQFFIESETPENMSLKVPGSTTNGIMAKQWLMSGDTQSLVKGTVQGYNPESFREVYASLMFSQVLKSSEFVMYSLSEIGEREPLSCCDNFITRDTEYVPMSYFLERDLGHKDEITYKYLKNLYGQNYHILDWTFLMDRILLNRDRHFGNFGFIRSAITGEILRPAPIFDTGASLFPYHSVRDSIEFTHPIELWPLAGDWDTMYSEIDFPRYKEGLLKLLDSYERLFHSAFSTSRSYNNPDQGKRWRNRLLKIIRSNIEHLLSKC